MTELDDALSKEELDNLQPEWEEMFRNTKRSTMWYNEAPMTAAAIFYEAAMESDRFREEFVERPSNGRWRDIMEQEVPEKYEAVMDINLSAFQGGHAEKIARREIRKSEPLSP